MVQLQAAKCPQCGADIQVNPALEQAMCQFCGTTILVNDAIEKYKVEITGTVKLDGISNRSDILTQAKKHFEVGEYQEAIERLMDIVEKDRFDVEAYCELIKNDIKILENSDYNPYAAKYNDKYNREYDEIYRKLMATYDRLIKIDKEEQYKKYLSEYMDYLSESTKVGTDINRANALCDEITKKLQDDLKEANEKGFVDDYFHAIRDSFQFEKVFYFKNVYSDYYRDGDYFFSSIEKVSIEGIFLMRYQTIPTQYNGYVPRSKEVYISPITLCKDYTELESRYVDYKTKIEEVKYNAEAKNKIKKTTKIIIIVSILVMTVLYLLLRMIGIVE